METIDISWFSLIIGFLLILIPLLLSSLLKLGLFRSISVAAIRMGIQLLLIGFFLEYLFDMNHPLVNIFWLLIMIIVAAYTVISQSELKPAVFLLPAFLSLALSIILITLFFNSFIICLDDVFEARYLIAIGGMILGNCLKSNIVGITHFYQSIKRNENRYFYLLSLGATQFELIMYFLKDSMKMALNPFIATMATFGIVSLPGMMTGQILGGTDPVVAIKYQIVIATAIFLGTCMSLLLTLLFSYKRSFNPYGVLRKGIFKTKTER
jgi:putative ABC transport system permease protein